MRVYATRILSIALAILLCCTPEMLLAATGQEAAAGQQSSGTQNGSAPIEAAPATAPVPQASQPAQSSPAGQTNGPASNTTTPSPQQSQVEGTAAARAARTIGGPASKPAGSAIAPAKQHQMRSLLIKIGAIAGAGAALGTVYALTRGTPSRPPGAH